MDLTKLVIAETDRSPGFEEFIERDYEKIVLTVSRRKETELTTGENLEELLDSCDADFYQKVNLETDEIQEYLDDAGWDARAEYITVFQKQDIKQKTKGAPEFILFLSNKIVEE